MTTDTKQTIRGYEVMEELGKGSFGLVFRVEKN